MDYYVFDCPHCGLQTEIELDSIESDTPIITCGKCESIWVTEIIPGDPWLEPLQQVE